MAEPDKRPITRKNFSSQAWRRPTHLYSAGITNCIISWGRSSAGRALEWHSRGRRFDPDRLHHPSLWNLQIFGWQAIFFH